MILFERCFSSASDKNEDNHPLHTSLETFPTIATSPLSSEQCAFITTARQNKKRILLCYLTDETLLHYREKALYHFDALQNAVRQRGFYVWWLYDTKASSALKNLPETFRDQYKKLREDFVSSDDTLLDDSGNFFKAVSYCDAYYGSRTSDLSQLNIPCVWAAPWCPIPHTILNSESDIPLNYLNGFRDGTDFFGKRLIT